MKNRNVFSRGDVFRANEATRKTLSTQVQGRTEKKSEGIRLSTSEINRAFAAARKTLAEA